jgi:hypothetical protein
MRNFKKVMALAISVAAVCTSVTAFAETEYNVEGLTGTYDAATNALSLTVDGAAGDKTVLVLDNGVLDTAATGEDILYINQYTADETAYATMKLKGETALAVGTYAVKIGYTDANGDFAIANGSIVVTEKQVQEPETVKVTFVLGDVDGDNLADGTDANYILAKVTGGTAKVGTYVIGSGIDATGIICGDVDRDNLADGTDANYILAKVTGGTAQVGTSTYKIGESVTIEVPVNN